MSLYFLRCGTLDRGELIARLVLLGALVTTDAGVSAADDGCWDEIGAVYRGDAPVLDELSAPLWHANLTTPIDLLASREAWGELLARWFVVDEHDMPRAPRSPYRVPAGWQPPQPPPPPTEDDYIAAVQAVLDDAARARGYDSIVSACSYAAAPNPFQAEAVAMLQWRADVWAHCYAVLAAVHAGTRPAPSRDELLAELPAMEA